MTDDFLTEGVIGKKLVFRENQRALILGARYTNARIFCLKKSHAAAVKRIGKYLNGTET
jgi:hypothetical protein